MSKQKPRTSVLVSSKRFYIAVLALGGFLIAILYYVYFFRIDIPLTYNALKLEYGKSVDIKKHTLLETKDPVIIDSIHVDTTPLQYKKGNPYPEVGQYKLKVQYTQKGQIQTKLLTLTVADTTAPKLAKSKSALELEYGASKENLLKLFTISDLSKSSIKLDDSTIDYKKSGKYSVPVIAEDIYGNKTAVKFQVTVKPKPQATPVESHTNDDVPANTKATYVNGIIIANKKHPLPSSYAPGENSMAKQQLLKLIAAMRKAGLNVGNSYSGYRSYAYQKQLYWGYVSRDGQSAADTYSARPGHSEHQTGLTFDLTYSSGGLIDSGPEAKWISNNAHKYGFIVRYQPGKEKITGYMSEPWHIRYIGSQALSIYQSGKTLEEYLGVSGGDYR
jgi:D-alanyl-D-alanine carboxypeptidase